MVISVQAVPCLNKKREFLVTLNGEVLLICGKNQVASVITVIENGKVEEELTTLSKSQQGRILKLKNQICRKG